jgi:hypothetical protein
MVCLMLLKDKLSINQDDLFLPVRDKTGANQKIQKLVDELRHPNIDWKFVVTSTRSYLFDYIYDIAPYADKVMPVIFHYLFRALERKRGSSLRAADTFFDRYSYTINAILQGNESFQSIKDVFDDYGESFIICMNELSRQGFYFENVIARVFNLGQTIIKNDISNSIPVNMLAEFVLLQYDLYINRSITTTNDELQNLTSLLDTESDTGALLNYLQDVSENQYAEKLQYLKSVYDNNPDIIF